MTQEQVQEQIRKEIARRKSIPLSDIDASSELLRGLGLDSLDYAAVVLGTEAAIGGELDESALDWAKIRTVADLASALHTHVKS